jgi:anaerobic selenocysteine-containing dehydrogenase
MNSKNIDTNLFQRFMNAYSSVSGKANYSASIEKLKDADAVVVLGTRVASDNQKLYEALKLISEKNMAKVVYAHPIEDVAMSNIASQFIKYEPGSEEGVLALLAYHLLKSIDLPESQRAFLDDLDLGYLEAESNIGEEEFEDLLKLFENSKNKVVVVGNDVMAHDRAENIAKICAMIEQNSEFSLLVDSHNEEERSQFHAIEINGKIEEVEDLAEYNGTVIYNLNPTQKSESALRGSEQFARAARISDGDYISILFAGLTINREFKIDSQLKGTIAINPTFDVAIDSRRYKFERSQINKINQRVRVS